MGYSALDLNVISGPVEHPEAPGGDVTVTEEKLANQRPANSSRLGLKIKMHSDYVD